MNQDLFLCLITHYIYGESGTELPPPVADTETFTEVSFDGETREAFSQRMAALVLPIRQEAEQTPARPYSSTDGWDWKIYVIKSITGRTGK